MRCYFSLCLIALLVSACSSKVVLKHQITPELAAVIKPQMQTSASLRFSSQVPETYVYKNGAGYSFEFPLNASTKSKLMDYFREKFPSASTQGQLNKNLEILVNIVKAEVGYEFHQNTGEVLGSLFGGVSSGQAEATATVTMEVSSAGVRTLPVTTVVGSSNSQGRIHNSKHSRSGSVEAVYAEAMDGAIDRAIVQIDKLISSPQPTMVAE